MTPCSYDARNYQLDWETFAALAQKLLSHSL